MHLIHCSLCVFFSFFITNFSTSLFSFLILKFCFVLFSNGWVDVLFWDSLSLSLHFSLLFSYFIYIFRDLLLNMGNLHYLWMQMLCIVSIHHLLNHSSCLRLFRNIPHPWMFHHSFIVSMLSFVYKHFSSFYCLVLLTNILHLSMFQCLFLRL